MVRVGGIGLVLYGFTSWRVVNTEAAFLPASNKPMLRADVPGFFFHKTMSQILMRAVDEGSARLRLHLRGMCFPLVSRFGVIPQ